MHSCSGIATSIRPSWAGNTFDDVTFFRISAIYVPVNFTVVSFLVKTRFTGILVAVGEFFSDFQIIVAFLIVAIFVTVPELKSF